MLIHEACASGARKRLACELLGVNLRTIERWEKENGLQDKRKQAEHSPANKLTEEQRSMILEVANRGVYQSLPPCKIVPMLADEGVYIASESTFYRVLREANQLAHRQRSRPSTHSKPTAYSAGGANEIWSWDITYLPTQVAGLYFYMYVIMDIFSRKIVGWSLHEAQSADYASLLIKQACLDEKIAHDLVLHSDNGSPMKGLTMRAMLEILGVIPSFSRPSVSDDNPYSESLFKTLKYRPTFLLLTKFEAIINARMWCEKLVLWYNYEHLHSALKFVTPHQRHSGTDVAIRAKRHEVYERAKQKNPERWSGKTRDWTLPTWVFLNPDKQPEKVSKTNTVKSVGGQSMRPTAGMLLVARGSEKVGMELTTQKLTAGIMEQRKPEINEILEVKL
jgi:putative transposase